MESLLLLINNLRSDDFVLPSFHSSSNFKLLSLRRNMLNNKVSIDDLKFLIKIYLSEGNNVERILKRLDFSSASKLQNLTTKLNIQPTNGIQDTVTLSRIAASLPELTATILEEEPDIHKIISLEKIRLESGHPEFPSIARQPSLACLLPREHPESRHILNVFFLANIMISETLNRTSKSWRNKSKFQRASDVQYFQEKYFRENLLIDRTEYCNKYKIMVDNDYSVVWKTAAEKAKAKLQASYGISF